MTNQNPGEVRARVITNLGDGFEGSYIRHFDSMEELDNFSRETGQAVEVLEMNLKVTRA